MNRIIIIIILIVTIAWYIWYTRPVDIKPPPIVIPTLMIPVGPTYVPNKTGYPLTEQAILLKFPQPGFLYKTPASEEIFDEKFTEKQNPSIRAKIGNKERSPIELLLCYAPYTNVMAPPPPDSSATQVITPESEYDIVGAYFFLTLSRVPNLSENPVLYNDFTKKILINTDNLKKILDYWKCSEKNQFFISSLMLKVGGVSLDELVKRISKYLFADYKINNPGDWYSLICT